MAGSRAANERTHRSTGHQRRDRQAVQQFRRPREQLQRSGRKIGASLQPEMRPGCRTGCSGVTLAAAQLRCHPALASRDRERLHPALVCRLGELTPKGTPSSSQDAARWWSRPRQTVSGSRGDALPPRRQRPPRPLQAGRTWRACDRALARSSRCASSTASPSRKSIRPRVRRAWQTTLLGREARLEFPASASGRRSAQPGGRACQTCRATRKGAQSAWPVPPDRAGSAGAPEPDRRSREQSGPVATSRPPAADQFSFVPRCSSSNSFMGCDGPRRP